MNFEQVLEECINEDLVRIIFSKPGKDAFSQKVKVRPISLKGKIFFQLTKVTGEKEKNTIKEIHENYSKEEIVKKIKEIFPEFFHQMLLETKDTGFTILAGKKGNISIRKNASVSFSRDSLEHDKKKNYLIEEGKPVDFLVDLKVMTKEGKVISSKYDKFRQINKYLEFIDECFAYLPSDREISIIDFGCGKSYLTFALYYYFVKLRNRRVRITGLDLKNDVIRECNTLKEKYGFEGLTFLEGDIEHFDKVKEVDMVISLHACDTATDYAIFKAIKWNAKIIMAVPCCQHELNKKLDNKSLKAITQYGILKDRLSAIITDAWRAELLSLQGYDTKVMEFIDMEHTPKNILIRAVKEEKRFKSLSEKSRLEDLKALTQTELTLERLLREAPGNEENHI